MGWATRNNRICFIPQTVLALKGSYLVFSELEVISASDGRSQPVAARRRLGFLWVPMGSYAWVPMLPLLFAWVPMPSSPWVPMRFAWVPLHCLLALLACVACLHCLLCFTVWGPRAGII